MEQLGGGYHYAGAPSFIPEKELPIRPRLTMPGLVSAGCMIVTLQTRRVLGRAESKSGEKLEV